MGGAIAERLAQAGADVAVADRRDTLLQGTAQAVTALGRRTVALSVDVTDTAQVAQRGQMPPDAVVQL
jgi:meso-butanediol dehydrogenase / (S,S)-butanediol dehydrogenase / diacetyl reductase